MKVNRGKVLSNTSWLISEKLVSVFGLIFITSYVAKYIGPSDFGRLNFAIYIFSIVQAVAVWGSDTICTKRISQNEESGIRILFSIFKLRVFIFFLVSFFVNLYFYMYSNLLGFIFCVAVTISTFFIIQDVYIIYNDSKLNSRVNVISNITGVILGFLIRYFIVRMEFPVWTLSFSIVAVTLVPFFVRRKIFFSNECSKKKSITKKHRSKYLAYVFLTGFPLVFSSISVAIYINASRLILGYTENSSVLGVYSVSIVIGSAWGFVNSAFIRSVTPKLYSCKSSREAGRLTIKVYYFLILVGIFYLISFYFAGQYIVNLLYGSSYSSAIKTAYPLLLSTCVSGLGMMSTLYIVYHGGYGYLGKKNIFTCVFGCIVSYVLIMHYGILGAALSTLTIELLSLTLFNYFFKKGLVAKLHIYIFNPGHVIDIVKSVRSKLMKDI